MLPDKGTTSKPKSIIIGSILFSVFVILIGTFSGEAISLLAFIATVVGTVVNFIIFEAIQANFSFPKSRVGKAIGVVLLIIFIFFIFWYAFTAIFIGKVDEYFLEKNA